MLRNPEKLDDRRIKKKNLPTWQKTSTLKEKLHFYLDKAAFVAFGMNGILLTLD